MKRDTKSIKAIIKLHMDITEDKFCYDLGGDLETNREAERWDELVVFVAADILDFCTKNDLRLSNIVIKVNDRFSYMLAWTVRLFYEAFGFDNFILESVKPS